MSKPRNKQNNRSLKGGSDRTVRDNAKRQAQKAEDMKRIMIAGAVAIAVAAVLSVVLIWYYGEPTVARIDGARLRAGDVTGTISWANTNLSQQQYWGDWDRTVREEAVRLVALLNLYKDYGRQLGLTFTGNEHHSQILNAVTGAIIDDPDEFARFEAYLPEDLQPAAEARAQEILARIRAGEDFRALMETYSEDFGGVAQYPEGYTFGSGSMVAEFEEGTLALEIGEVSEPIQSQFGFHIIKRIEPDPENIMGGAVVPEDELLGAMHILIAVERLTLEDRMAQAVTLAFDAKLADINFEFLPALYEAEL